MMPRPLIAWAILLALPALPGCAVVDALRPPPQVETVRVPVPVSCLPATLPTAPADRSASLAGGLQYDDARALLVELRERRAYDAALEPVLIRCGAQPSQRSEASSASR